MKERAVEEDISCLGGRLGRGTPYREGDSAGILSQLRRVSSWRSEQVPYVRVIDLVRRE